jgi:hypothetical protein
MKTIIILLSFLVMSGVPVPTKIRSSGVTPDATSNFSAKK